MRSATCTYRVIMHSRVSYLLFACLLWGGLTCSLGQRNVGTEKMATNSEGTDRPTQELHLLGLFPFHGAFTGGEGYLPSVMMGIEDVNKLSDILPGYRLNLIWNDTMCVPGIGVDAMFRLLFSPPTKIMVLGAACSPVTQATAETSYLWNLVQLSYTSSSPTLSNKKRFPWFFRVSSPDVMFNQARVAMMLQFGWKRVASIHQSFELFSSVADDLVRRFQRNNITLITSEIFTDEPSLQVQNLKKHDTRIVVGGFYEDMALRVFCEAFKIGMYGRNYVWILVGWFNDGWWKKEDPTLDCTPEEMALVAEGAIHTGIVYTDPNQINGISGMTSNMWQAEYDRRTGGVELSGKFQAAQGYDAVWAVALALNFTLTELIESGSRKRLEDFTYTDFQLARMIYDNMWKVNFQGIKGRIFFDSNGDHPGMVEISRLQGVRSVVGFYRPFSDTDGVIDWLPENPIIWEGGTPPHDSTTTVVQQELVQPALYGAMCTAGGAAILLAIGLIAFNVINRKVRLIKMSSPAMNNIMVLGCIVMYSTVFFEDLDLSTTQIFCKIRTFTMMVGFSLAFGALFAKTWRVHLIFTKKLQKTVIHDQQLVVMVTVIVAVDVCLFTVRELLDPQQVVRSTAYTEVRDGGDLVIKREVSQCTSVYKNYFLGLVFATKGLLLVFGMFLAWETRKVTIPALNDSQYIGMCIYNVVILSTLGVILAFVLDNQVQIRYALISGLLIFGTLVTELIIFVPKTVLVPEFGGTTLRNHGQRDLKNHVRDSEETDDGTKSTFAARITTSGKVPTTGNESETDNHDITWYKNRVRELERELEETKVQLEEARGTTTREDANPNQ